MSKSLFHVGDTVTYEKWDGEEGRGYGWFRVNKKAKIVSICYKLDTGDIVEEKSLVKVEQSKSEITKEQKNDGSSS
jgi:hypothetical protein